MMKEAALGEPGSFADVFNASCGVALGADDVQGRVEDAGFGFVSCFGFDHRIPTDWYEIYRLVGILSTGFLRKTQKGLRTSRSPQCWKTARGCKPRNGHIKAGFSSPPPSIRATCGVHGSAWLRFRRGGSVPAEALLRRAVPVRQPRRNRSHAE